MNGAAPTQLICKKSSDWGPRMKSIKMENPVFGRALSAKVRQRDLSLPGYGCKLIGKSSHLRGQKWTHNHQVGLPIGWPQLSVHASSKAETVSSDEADWYLADLGSMSLSQWTMQSVCGSTWTHHSDKWCFATAAFSALSRIWNGHAQNHLSSRIHIQQ